MRRKIAWFPRQYAGQDHNGIKLQPSAIRYLCIHRNLWYNFKRELFGDQGLIYIPQTRARTGRSGLSTSSKPASQCRRWTSTTRIGSGVVPTTSQPSSILPQLFILSQKTGPHYERGRKHKLMAGTHKAQTGKPLPAGEVLEVNYFFQTVNLTESYFRMRNPATHKKSYRVRQLIIMRLDMR